LLLIGLVVDDEVFCKTNGRSAGHRGRNAQSFNVPPQHPHAKRMKRRDDGLGHGQAADDLVHPLDHFGGGLVGESNRQDRLRHRAQVFD